MMDQRKDELDAELDDKPLATSDDKPYVKPDKPPLLVLLHLCLRGPRSVIDHHKGFVPD